MSLRSVRDASVGATVLESAHGGTQPMKVDRTTKILLLLITLGLWLNAAVTLIQPARTKAELDYSDVLRKIESNTDKIAIATYEGVCVARNSSICH